ncbi:MAG: peptidoglycan-binding protein [Acidobacteria bacterium]|nr:peptidoglycan-binding protein [Acidobacteriota bacterium]
MPFHDVQLGETLIGIAAKNRLDSADTVLDRSENAELKKVRPDVGILKQGDKVFVPNREMRQEACAIDSSHKFVAKKPKAWIRIVAHDADGKVVGKSYELRVWGKVASGAIPADGILELQVPVDATDGILLITMEDGTIDRWDLRLGYMDPIAETSGIQSRLNNLGFPCGDPDGVLDDETKAAIRAFQAYVGIEVTGAIDDTLRTKLTSFYDPAQDESSQKASS